MPIQHGSTGALLIGNDSRARRRGGVCLFLVPLLIATGQSAPAETSIWDSSGTNPAVTHRRERKLGHQSRSELGSVVRWSVFSPWSIAQTQ